MNIKQIEGNFDLEFGDRNKTPWDIFLKKKQRETVKQFYAHKITELLNSLKMEEKEFKEIIEYPKRDGFNQAVRELNNKIDKILHQ